MYADVTWHNLAYMFAPTHKHLYAYRHMQSEAHGEIRFEIYSAIIYDAHSKTFP